MATPPMDRATEDKIKQLSEIEAPALRAKEYVKSKEFEAAQFHALEKIRKVVKMGIVEQGESLMILGRIQQILDDTYQHETTITQYDYLKKTLAESYVFRER